MSRKHTCGLLAFLLLASTAACGGGAQSVLIIEVADQELPADGMTTTTLTVRAIFQGNPVPDGTQIKVKVSDGKLGEDGETEADVSTVGGAGTIEYLGPYEEVGPEGKPVAITASYTDPYDQVQQASATLLMVQPPPIDGNAFNFFCELRNAGLPQNSEPLRVGCTVAAKDVDQRTIPADFVRFQFMSEVGYFEIDERSGRLEWVLPPGQIPVDVEPAGTATDGEPRWLDPATNRTRNPRDGIVTLVVHTRGKPGTPDTLLGEPYVDLDDNGQYDMGEPYFDADENGAYTGPGVSATGEARIWRWAKIMLTGGVDPDAAVASGLGMWLVDDQANLTVNVARGATASLQLFLIDSNLNPIASHDDRDEISLSAQPSQADITPRNLLLARDQTGVSFNPNTGALDGYETRAGYLKSNDIVYGFTLFNGLSPGDDPATWFLESATVRRTPYPGAQSVTENLPTTPGKAPSGTLE